MSGFERVQMKNGMVMCASLFAVSVGTVIHLIQVATPHQL